MRRQVPAVRRDGSKPVGWIRCLLLLLFATFVVGEAGLRIWKCFIDPPSRWQRTFFRSDAAVGFAVQPNLRNRVDVPDLDLHFTLDTNDEGLRGIHPIPPKPPGSYRILVLGDSFTFGLGVESDETFPAVLERNLAGPGPPVAVINAGTPSYGTVHEAAFYRARGAAMEPDLVLVAFYDNDRTDNLDALQYVDGVLQRDPLVLLGHTSYLVELIDKRVIHPRPRRDDSEHYANQVLRALRKTVEQDGRRFLIVHLPARETTKFALASEPHQAHLPLDAPATILLDLHPLVEGLDHSPYIPEHHFSVEGNAIVARAIADFVMDRALKPAGIR